MAAERGEIPNTLTFLIPRGGQSGTLTFFWNQSLTGQHLANSGEAQLKKSPCIFSPVRLLKLPLCRSRSRCLTWTATGQWMLQNSVSSPTLWDRTVLLAVGTGNSVSQFGFCFLLESDSSFYLSSLFPAQTNLLALSCLFFIKLLSRRLKTFTSSFQIILMNWAKVSFKESFLISCKI